jgi:hypothetical protein
LEVHHSDSSGIRARTLSVDFRQRRRRQKKTECWRLCGDCLQVSSRFSRREDRDNDMATEGRRYAGKKNPELMRRSEIDEELADIRARNGKACISDAAEYQGQDGYMNGP